MESLNLPPLPPKSLTYCDLVRGGLCVDGVMQWVDETGLVVATHKQVAVTRRGREYADVAFLRNGYGYGYGYGEGEGEGDGI